jgi:hypothetical protein
MWLAYALSAVLALAVLGFALANGKAYPIWETWYFIHVWEQFATGGPWFRSLFDNHWGHIHAIPNAINLFVGYVTDYNMKVDIVVTWLAAVAAFAIVLRFVPLSVGLVLGAASAFFTTRSVEVWVSSWNLMWTMSVLMAAAIGWSLSGALTARRVGTAVAIGAASIITAGQGIAVVAAGLVPLALKSWWDPRSRWALWLWVVVLAALVIAFKAMRPASGSLAAILSVTPASFFDLVSVSILRRPHPLAGGLLVGAAALAFVWCALTLREDQQFLFWAYLLAFAVIFSLLVASTRAGVHLRYLIVTWIIPAAAAVMWYKSAETRRSWRPVMHAVIGIWLAANLYYSYEFGRVVWGWQAATARLEGLARDNPQALEPKDFLRIAADDEKLVGRGLETMKRLKVNIFAR